MKLYQKIDIDEFELIRDELLKFVEPQISQQLRYWDINYIEFLKNTPRFIRYISKMLYRPPVLFRFYNTPPFSKLAPHVDNLADSANKIGFNIPLLNTENTLMKYYETTADNMEIAPSAGFASMPAQLIIDTRKLVLLDSFVLDKPAIVRTDIIHEVVNDNDSYRLVLGMKLIGDNFEEVFKFNIGA